MVTTHNYARFLGEALDSVLAQTVKASEIVVIDDGSTDDPASVVAQYPQVRLVTIPNQGIAKARNVGLEHSTAPFVIFLDADDLLAPVAIESGLECMKANPGAGFVYGAYRLVSKDREPIGLPTIARIKPHAYHALLRDNVVRMHAAVLYDREKLIACGGYDNAIARCEDYDMYLRMARRFRVACHPGVVADYRLHGANMSLDATEMLAWHLKVLDHHRPPDDDVEGMKAWRAGNHHWKMAFTNFVWTERGASGAAKWIQRAKMMRVAPRITPSAAIRQFLVQTLPDPVVDLIRRVRRPRISPKLGEVDFGDLARLKPLSTGFGFLRGTPIDRYYIGRFLERHRAEVRGRVMEVNDPLYSEEFDSGITQQDVLNLHPGAGTTIAGDIGTEGLLPSDTFDCIIFTQTLQYIYEPIVALRQMHRALKEGGVLLATIPYISPIDNADWNWYWSFTPKAVNRLFEESFGVGNFEMEVHGNVFAATCFLQGVAVEDIDPSWIDQPDPSYPVNITVRAVKPA